MSKKFSFNKASESDTGIGRESLPMTNRLNRLHERLKDTFNDIELEKQLKEELKNSFNKKGIFEDTENTENIKRIKNKLNIKASDYQKLKREIVNEVNKKTSASLHNKNLQKKKLEL